MDRKTSWFELAVVFAGVLVFQVTAGSPVGAQGGEPTVNILQNGSFEVGLKNWHSYSQGTNAPVQPQIYYMDPRLQRTVASDAPDGAHFAQLDLPEASVCFVSSRPYSVSPGRVKLTGKYRGRNTARLALVNSGKLDNNVIAYLDLAGSTTWRSVTIDATLGTDVEQVCVSLVVYGPGRFRIDDFKLLVENAVQRQVDIAIESSAPNGVYTRSETPAFVARAYSAASLNGVIEYQVFNAWNEQVGQGTIPMNLTPGVVAQSQLQMQMPETGHYRILAEFKASGQAVSAASETLFAVIPDRAPLSGEEAKRNRFGCNMEERPELIALAQKIGISWVMCAPPIFTKWISVEPLKGQWIFNDNVVNAMHAAGLQLLGSLADPPTWAVEPGSPAYSGPWPNPKFPASWGDWDNYVQQVVSHYSGRIDYWAVWNEPNHPGFLELGSGENWIDKYMQVLPRSYSLVKQTNPGAVVVGGNVTNPGALPPLIQAGGWQYMDIGGFHWASWVPSGYLKLTGEEAGYFDPNSANYIGRITESMKQAGKVFPMWNTECHITEADFARSYTTIPNPAKQYSTPRMTSLESAAAIPRQFVVEWAAGIEKTFFWLLAYQRNSWDSQTVTNLVEWDRSAAPALVSFAVATSILKDAEFLGYTREIDQTLPERPAFYAFHFSTPEGRVRVVWATTDTPRQKAFRVRGGRVRALDMFGVDRIGAPGGAVLVNDTVVLNLTRFPYYIIDTDTVYDSQNTIYSNRNLFVRDNPGLTLIDYEGYCPNNGYLWFHNQSISGVLFQGHGGYVWNNFPNLHIFGPDLFPPEKPTDWNSGCVLVGPADGWVYADLPAGTKAFGTDVMTYRIDQWGPNETVLAATYGFHAHAWVKYGDGSEGLYYWNPTFQRPNRAFWGLVSDKEIDWVAMWSTANQNAYIVWDNTVYGFTSRPEATSISQAKTRTDGQQARVAGKIVTAVFGDSFYIEEPDRTAGIKVVRTNHNQSPGNSVQVIGVMRTASSGERYIDATTGMVDYVIGTPLQPLGMNNRSLGGSSFGESPVWQAGVADGVGPNNIGLLIRTAGRVLESGSGWFRISDGSGVTVKVIGTAPAGNPYVMVTGISSLESPNGSRVVLAVSVNPIPE